MSFNSHSQWGELLNPEFKKDYMLKLKSFLKSELKMGKTIFPHTSEYFAALSQTSWEKVRVVILGQDPYYNKGQAHGFCFSVRPQMAIPPSLKNIFKEIENELGVQQTSHGCLLPWADQGVLLLNATLTVEAYKPGSHQGKGWEIFTDKIVEVLNKKKENLVFLLWGSYAQKKGAYINKKNHLVLKAAHPSPFSSHRGFLGCNHFIKTNQYLESKGFDPICWKLPKL